MLNPHHLNYATIFIVARNSTMDRVLLVGCAKFSCRNSIQTYVWKVEFGKTVLVPSLGKITMHILVYILCTVSKIQGSLIFISFLGMKKHLRC